MMNPYVNELGEIAERLHQPRFLALLNTPTRKGEWCGRFQIIHALCFIFAVLYRHTRDEASFQRAKSYLLEFDNGYHFSALMLQQAFAILEPRLTESEKHAFATRWVAALEPILPRYTTRNPAEIAQWTSVSNHALCACYYADAARTLFPAVAAPYRFQRITDKVWSVWWKRREFHEQASNYEGFSECFLCAWAELRGVKEAFYRTPSIRNMLERGLKIVSPAGIVAAYGDSGHNEHATAWMALFEKAAEVYGDGTFQAAAERAFAFVQKHVLRQNIQTVRRALTENIYNGRMLYAQNLSMIAWLAMAALWHTRKLRPAARPPAVTGVIARMPINHVQSRSELNTLPRAKLITGQVALTGGPAGSPTYLLVSTGPEWVHDHADAGSILSISRGDCCLLGTNGYLQRELLYHQAVYAQAFARKPYPDDTPGKATPGAPATRATIEALELGARRSHVRLSIEPYHNLPLALTRAITIDEQGAILLSDTLTAREAGLAGGPLFHGESIRRLDSRRFLLRNAWLKSMCGVTMKNPRGALLVELQEAGADVRLRHLKLPAVYKAYKGFPVCHYKQIWAESYTGKTCLALRRILEPGVPVTFTVTLKMVR